MTYNAPPNWRAAGACAFVDPDLFFPVSARGMAAADARRACQVCASCQVRRQCLDFAMRNSETDGIWGGTTPQERGRARRAMKTSRPGPAPRAA